MSSAGSEQAIDSGRAGSFPMVSTVKHAAVVQSRDGSSSRRKAKRRKAPTCSRRRSVAPSTSITCSAPREEWSSVAFYCQVRDVSCVWLRALQCPSPHLYVLAVREEQEHHLQVLVPRVDADPRLSIREAANRRRLAEAVSEARKAAVRLVDERLLLEAVDGWRRRWDWARRRRRRLGQRRAALAVLASHEAVARRLHHPHAAAADVAAAAKGGVACARPPVHVALDVCVREGWL